MNIYNLAYNLYRVNFSVLWTAWVEGGIWPYTGPTSSTLKEPTILWWRRIMEIRISQEMGAVPVTVFHIDGRINLGTSDDLLQRVQTVFDEGSHNLLLDLSDVLSITSEGLRVLHQIYKLYLDEPSPGTENEEILEAGAGPTKAAHFKLLNPSSDILRVLKVAGFDSFIEVHEDFDEAVASFKR
jgi:anti-anti-sigma regulatory factor